MGGMREGGGCLNGVGEGSKSELTLAKVKLELELDLDQELDHMELFEHLVCCEIEGTKKIKRNAKRIKVDRNKKNKERGSRGRPPPAAVPVWERAGQAVNTSSIASSLLEGVFAWSSDRWSYSTEVRTSAGAAGATTSARRRQRRRRPADGAGERLCDVCGAVFASQGKLTSHRRSHAEPTMVCPAPGCSKRCNSRRNLARHHARRHAASERRHACAAAGCGKRFAFRAELTHHAKRHDHSRYPRKTYACSHCGKLYKTRQSVEIHERSAHTGERPARCDECGAAFFHETYLREHVRLHTGETPYACPVCARGYAQRANMKSHLRSHRLALPN